MIYTIVALSDVFAEKAAPVTIRRTDNGYAEYVSFHGREQLRRLVSTVPSDYLHL